MQKLWLAGISWDEEIPKDLLKEWFIYRKSLFALAEWEIPRYVGLHPGHETTIHGFCDASSHAYAAVIYVRTVDENRKATVRLLTSKSRVAPVKTVSIPRLELCGVQLLVTTLNTVREATELRNVEYFLWTDSTIVLAWLRQLPNRYKPYVANRVSYVQQHSEPTAWHHIPTGQNPADCASRGMTIAKLQEYGLWWNGPEFLQRGDDYSSAEEPVCTEDEQKDMRAEQKVPTALHMRINQKAILWTRMKCGKKINLLDRTDSYVKMQRIMATILYAIRSRKNEAKGEICTVERMAKAAEALARMDQAIWFKSEIEACKEMATLPKGSLLATLDPFIDIDGILRVGGRLKRADISMGQKYPIILARDSRLAYMIVEATHKKLLHGGVQAMLYIIRQTHWIIGGRALMKSYVHHGCETCRLHRGEVAKQKMGDLPKQRVTRHRPFSISGVDYAGPFTLRMGAKRSKTTAKTYIVIFVCLATKAVHIELATDLSTNAFLNAFARFTGRRGPCEEIHSDNGTNFHGANRRMKEDLREWHTENFRAHLANNGTNWKFIPPAAPHQGGIWKAAVKSAKRHILREVGNCIMTYEQFNTLLIRVEACLNSRPLVALHDDPDDKLALTPGDFLVGGPIIALPEPSQAHLPMNRITEWKLVRRWTEEIWRRWHMEYLQTLQARSKWRKPEENIRIGDVVAIKEENLPPTQWCIVCCDNKAFQQPYFRRRPIQKICLLFSEKDSGTNVPEEARMSQSDEKVCGDNDDTDTQEGEIDHTHTQATTTSASQCIDTIDAEYTHTKYRSPIWHKHSFFPSFFTLHFRHS